MPDLKQRLDAIDLVPVDDVWPEILERFEDEAAGRVTPLRSLDPTRRPEVGWRKALTIAAVFVLLAAAGFILFRSLTSDGIPANPPVELSPTPAQVGSSGALAYTDGSNIYVADPDGSNAVKIVDGAADDECSGVGASWSNESPAWSPDGRYLAFWHGCSGSDQPSETTVMVTDARGNVVGEFPKGLWGFTWSPDSTHIAVWGGDLTGIVDVYGIDGERVASLDFPPRMRPHNDAWPGWMPDGTAILLQGEFVVPLDGSAPYDLGLGGAASFSPDGVRVAVATGSYIRILDADGSFVSQVIGLDEAQAWSPDGERFASASPEGELALVDVASGTVTTLSEATAAVPFGTTVFGVRSFSPDGDRILYFTADGAGGGAGLWSIGVDGSDPRLLVPGVLQGEWAP